MFRTSPAAASYPAWASHPLNPQLLKPTVETCSNGYAALLEVYYITQQAFMIRVVKDFYQN